MKKTGVIITSVVCGSIILLGCTTPSSPANVARNLDANLTNLTTTINKLDTIDNSYLSNPDIYPITSSIETPAPENKNTIVAKVSTNDFNLFVPISNQRKKIAKHFLALNENTILDTTQTNTTTVTTQTTETSTATTELDESGNLSNNEGLITEDTNVTETETETTDLTTLNSDEQTTNIFYYDIKPVRYAPRYARDIRAIQNEDYLANYISKVRNLYAITNDAIMANNQLSNYKNDVITYCVEIKDLNSAIKDGTFVPTTQQVAALNNYIDDIKVTIKRIKKCNGDLSDEVDSINKTDVGGITAGIDVINSNYLSVLNHLDTRITYLKNALTTLEQIKYLLQEAQNIVETNPDVTEEVITPEIIAPEQTGTNSDTTPNTDETITTDETNNSSNTETDTTTNNLDNVEQTETETTDSTEDSNTTTNNESFDENNENVSTETNTEIDETVVESTENDNETSNDELNIETNENSGNIDTYLNTNNNLDTYNLENSVDSDNLENTINTDTLAETNNTNLQNNNITDQTPNTVTTPIINNGTTYNNGANGMVYPTDEEKINAPNGTFQNGIITQNNLNNGVNNGVNGYHTGYSGSSNYPYTNGDINRTNKNVDTYGYNTMIDMLNHGTVNNGINTLNLTEEVNTKPSMVSNENVLNNTNEICEECENETNNCEECENCLDNSCESCKEKLAEIKTDIDEVSEKISAPNTNDYEVELL